MFQFIIIFLMLCPMLLNAKGIDDVRTDFHNIDDETRLIAFLKMVDEVNDDRKIPYKIAAAMQQALYTSNPFKKLKYFNQGRQELDAFIAMHPQNIEAYYVRFLVQTEAPVFLGYRQDIEHDSIYIMEHLDAASLPKNYKGQILQTMNKLLKN